MWRCLVLSILILVGCSEKPAKAPAAVQGVQVRYRNLSQESFKLLETEIYGSRNAFKNISAGGVTDFITVPKADAYHHVRVVTEKDTLTVNPVGMAPEQVYTKGFMTMSLDIVVNGDGSRELVVVRNGARPVRDYHTTASDVIDNLFVFLNAKEWKAMQSVYAPDATLKDEQGLVIFESPAAYFQKLFAAEDINYIYVSEQKTSGQEVTVKAMTRKGARSAEYPYCYTFTIVNNRITRQSADPCTR